MMRPLPDCTGRALSGYKRLNSAICAGDACTGYFITSHTPPSLQGGEVSDPIYV